MKRKYLLFIPIALCIGWIIPDLFNPSNTGDWLAFIIGELYIQLLIKKE